ncbi:MAG: TetR/AcrR family transcriptional regulator [Solirubrobacterales bacterium]|nr:TetR/AcrR family transcriptional regulator [Solirubrobacterales bacterium]
MALRRRDNEVLEAAVRVFYTHGYSDATVQNIADELDMLKGSLYHYMRTKEDLLFRIFEVVHADVERLAEEAHAAPNQTPLERLRMYVRRQVEYNLAHHERIMVYYHDLERLSGERLAVVKARLRAHTTFVTGLVEAAQARGEIDRDRDARLLTNCVFATIIWPYRWYRADRRMSVAAIVDACDSFVLFGLAAPQ